MEQVLGRDRLVVSIVLGALTLVSWAQMVLPNDGQRGGERLMPCCGARLAVAFSMWVVMMAGMMIPSVAPMVLTDAAIVRRRVMRGAPFVSSGLFLVGNLLAWSGFSAVAALAQSVLYRSALLDGHSLTIGPSAGSAVLIAAGLFQLSSAKSACLVAEKVSPWPRAVASGAAICFAGATVLVHRTTPPIGSRTI